MFETINTHVENQNKKEVNPRAIINTNYELYIYIYIILIGSGRKFL